jgi:hypothetical protein
MVGGKREKDEFAVSEEQERSIEGRPRGVKNKSLDIEDVSAKDLGGGP